MSALRIATVLAVPANAQTPGQSNSDPRYLSQMAKP
jgi:hypothetical protein